MSKPLKNISQKDYRK